MTKFHEFIKNKNGANFFLLMEKRDKRVIIHFLWKQGLENKAICVKINEVYG